MATQTTTSIVGHAVETADGERLGAVSKVWGDYFKVYASEGPDYWLPRWEVMDVEIDMVRVIFTTKFLDEHKVAALRI